MKPVLCIFHAHCDDGFAAAWAVRRALGVKPGVEFYPGIYQQPPPDVTGRHVLMVDFSYKRPVIDAMIGDAESLLILDHHATAKDDLADLLPVSTFRDWSRSGAYVGALFDMNRSGAGIAWDFFHPNPRPAFIDYIEDRDLWRKKLEGGDEFTIALRSYPQDFEIWDKLVDDGPRALIEQGRSIQRYYRLRIEEIKRSAYLARMMFKPVLFTGEPITAVPLEATATVAIANAPYFAASEVAGELCEMDGAVFGACYFEVAKGRWQYSLRSRGEFDVSAVAKLFGGGGHKAAAGFTVDAPVHF